MEIIQNETVEYFLENKYAKLFSVKTNLNNDNKWNKIQLIFRLIHFSSDQTNVICNKFAFACKKINNKNIINFKDLEPELVKLSCAYTIENDIVTVYVKGMYSGANIKCCVIYGEGLGFFEFYNYEKFEHTLKNPIFAKVNDGLYKKSIGMSKNTLKTRFRGDTQYSFIGKVLSFTDNVSFTGLFAVSECRTGTVTGMSYLYYVEFNNSELKGNVTNLSSGITNKKLSLIVEKNSKEYNIYLKINGVYDYGTVIITPILYDTADNGVFYLSECEKLVDIINTNQIVGMIENKTFVTKVEPATIEKNDIIGMINELKSEIEQLKNL